MSRAVEEWIGKDDDTAIPARVRLRVFTKADGRCTAGCRRKIRPGETWTLEHVIALINWRKTDDQPHGNRESNLGVTCCNCLPAKNAADVSEKKIINRKRAKHLGIKNRANSMPGSKASGWKKKMNGEVVRR